MGEQVQASCLKKLELDSQLCAAVRLAILPQRPRSLSEGVRLLCPKGIGEAGDDMRRRIHIVLLRHEEAVRGRSVWSVAQLYLILGVG